MVTPITEAQARRVLASANASLLRRNSQALRLRWTQNHRFPCQIVIPMLFVVREDDRAKADLAGLVG